jgi:hypothetical protein
MPAVMLCEREIWRSGPVHCSCFGEDFCAVGLIHSHRNEVRRVEDGLLHDVLRSECAEVFESKTGVSSGSDPSTRRLLERRGRFVWR